MTLFIVLAFLLPWSIYRQMHEHAVTRQGLYKLPIIFAAIGLFGFGVGTMPTDASAIAYIAVSLAVSVLLGVWRGTKLTLGRDADGQPTSKGNRTTLTLWGVLIASKFALGTVASVTGWFPPEHAGEVFLFLAFSFVAQNLVVAARTGILAASKPVRGIA